MPPSADSPAASIFGALGQSQAKHPVVFPVVGFAVAAILAGIGIPGFRDGTQWKTEVSDLWIQDGGRVANELDWLASPDIDGESRTDNELIMTAVGRDHDGDVLTADALTSHLRGAEAAFSVTITHAGDSYSLADFSAYSFGAPYATPPVRATPLDCFAQGAYDYPAVMPYNLYPTRPDFTTLAPAQIREVVDAGCNYFDGGANLPSHSLDNIVGGRSYSAAAGCSGGAGRGNLTKAMGLQTAYVTVRDEAFVNRMRGFADEDGCTPAPTVALLRRPGGPASTAPGLPAFAPDLVAAKQIRRKLNEAIEEAVSAAGAAHQSKSAQGPGAVTVTGAYMSTSLSAELDRQQSLNRLPLLAGYIVMLAYVTLSLAGWSCGGTGTGNSCVAGRAGVGIASVVTVGMGVAAGFGLSGIAGIDMNITIQSVLPLVLLGIGIDDVFVMCHNFDTHGDDDDGVAAAAESTEAVMARFMAEVGPSVTLTSITNIAIFSIAAEIPVPVVADFSLTAACVMCTVWLAVLFVFPAFLAMDRDRRRAGRADVLCCVTPGAGGSGTTSMARAFVDTVYAPFVTSPLGVAVGVCALAALTAAAAARIGDVELDLQVADVIDSDSLIRPAVEVRFEHFDTYGFRMVTRNITFDTVDIQHRLIAAHERLTATPHVMRDYFPHLLVAFYGWAAPSLPGQCDGGPGGAPTADCPRGSFEHGCTFGLFNPPKDMPTPLVVKNETAAAAAATTGATTCADDDADAQYQYPICWGAGSAELAAMRGGVAAATMAAVLAAAREGALAQAGQAAAAAAGQAVQAGALAQTRASVYSGDNAAMVAAALAQAGEASPTAAAAALISAAAAAAAGSDAGSYVGGSYEDDGAGAAAAAAATAATEQLEAIYASIGRSAVLTQALVSTGQAADAQAAAVLVPSLTADQQAQLLHAAAENALIGSAISPNETAAAMPAAQRAAVLLGAAETALIGQALSPTDPADGVQMAAGLTSEQREAALSGAARAAAAAQVYQQAQTLQGNALTLTAALAAVQALPAAHQTAIIEAGITSPKWGLEDNPAGEEVWCMGMAKEPVSLSGMFDAATLTNHPHQLGPTRGFRQCFDTFVRTSPTASLLGADYFRTTATDAAAALAAAATTTTAAGASATPSTNATAATCTALASSRPANLSYPMPISSSPMTAVGLSSGPAFVDLIREARGALHEQDPVLLDATLGRDMFPTGIPFEFWEQYVNLLDELREKLGYALAVAVATVTVLLLALMPDADAEGGSGSMCAVGSLSRRVLAAVWGAAVVCAFCVVTVVQTYGFMAVCGIKLNAVPQVTLVMTMGIAVEFTAHTVLAFLCAPEPEPTAAQGASTWFSSRRQRCAAALGKMAVPTAHGAMTTFLGIVMISTSKSEFIVLYYFVLYALIVAFGVVNGLIVLPAVLVLAGPLATTTAAAGSAVSSASSPKKLGDDGAGGAGGPHVVALSNVEVVLSDKPSGGKKMRAP